MGVGEQKERFKGTPIVTKVGFPSSHHDAGLIVGFKSIYHVADFVGGESSLGYITAECTCKSPGV